LSELNKIKVKNARGYARAVLSVAGAEGNSYRVFDLVWKDKKDPNNHEATLTLKPLPNSDDLPADLPGQAKVSLITFALLLDIPPLALADSFDVRPDIAFTQYHKIEIPTAP
jgi:hypothetical protein